MTHLYNSGITSRGVTNCSLLECEPLSPQERSQVLYLNLFQNLW